MYHLYPLTPTNSSFQEYLCNAVTNIFGASYGALMEPYIINNDNTEVSPTTVIIVNIIGVDAQDRISPVARNYGYH